MSTQPARRGWYHHPEDPVGVNRWFDGQQWSKDTTGVPASAPIARADRWSESETAGLEPTHGEAEVVAEPDLATVGTPRTRGWHHRDGDPAGVQRWYNGSRWTDDFTGGTAELRASAPRLDQIAPAESPPTQMPSALVRSPSALLDYGTLVPRGGFFRLSQYPGRPLIDSGSDLAVDAVGYPVIPQGCAETALSRWLIQGEGPIGMPRLSVAVDSLGRGRNGGEEPYESDVVVAGEFAVLLTDRNIRLSAMSGIERDGNRLARRDAVVAFKWPLLEIDEVGYTRHSVGVVSHDPAALFGGEDATPASQNMWMAGLRRRNKDFAVAVANAVADVIVRSVADPGRKRRAAEIRAGRWEAGTGLDEGATIARFSPRPG